MTQYLLGGRHALAVQRSDAPADPLLLLTDNAGSIVTEADREGTRHASYSAYGERPDANGMRCLLALNGEVREEALGWYLLGSGYRAYNPQLMRFHSPDSLAPEEAGLNPYLYALGNPVRWRDPTGHKVSPLNGDQTPDKKEEQNDVTGNLMGILVFGLVFIASVAITPWAGPVTFSFALTWGGIAAQGIGLGLQIAGFATKNDNPELSKKLAIAGLAISAIGVTMSMVGRSMTPRRSGPNSSSRSPSRSTPGSRPTPGSPGRDLREQMELTRMRIQERLQQIQQRRMPPPTYGSVMNGSAGARPVPSSPPSYGHATGNSVASQLSGNRSISGNSTPQSIHDNPVINTANTQAPYSRVSSPTVTPPPNRR
ncbi:RHS repeat-associated core domain protein [compost metagenome]